MDEQLLIRHLTHQCNAEEIKAIDEWISADKDNAAMLFEMECLWSIKDESQFSDPEKIEQSYAQLTEKLTKKKHGGSTHKKLPYRKNTITLISQVAAVLILCLLAINAYLMLKTDDKTPAVSIIEVPAKQSANVTLPDGSKLHLNAMSRLTYPVKFSKKSREVTLSGEAFFDIAKDEKKPFTVHAGELDVKVHGTKFNMKAYDAEPTVVSLQEGSVEIKTDETDAFRLKPKEQAVYSKASGMTVHKDIDLDMVKAWTNGELFFENTPLGEIAKNIERKYNIKINFAEEELKNDLYTFHSRENASVDFVMSLLKNTRKMRYRYINENEIEIIN